MQSWMMSLWLKRHDKTEWPDLSISQPEDAYHVSIKDEHHSVRAIEEMCSEGFFAEHDYRYVQSDGAVRVPEDLYDDMSVTKCCSDLQDEDLYEDPAYELQRGASCYLANTKKHTGLNSYSIEPRYQNGHTGVTKTDLLGEEPYDDVVFQGSDSGHVGCLEKLADLTVVSAEPRYQNVRIDVTKGVVEDVHEEMTDAKVYDDITDKDQVVEDEFGIYEEIGGQSPDLCHAASTDEHPSNCSSENYSNNSEEDIEREITDPADDELYEEIGGPEISQPFEAGSFTNPGNNKIAEAVNCGEVVNGMLTTENDDDDDDDDEPVYAEVGDVQLPESTTRHQDTTAYNELLPRDYMPLRRDQATFNSRDTNPFMKDVAKLNNRRRQHNSKD